MSNLIKNSRYVPVDDKKVIHIIKKPDPPVKEEQVAKENNEEQETKDSAALEEIKILKEKILKDAEESAEAQIKQAMDEVSSVKEQAEQDIKKWWEEKRELDEQYKEEAKGRGYELGYQEGSEKAVQEVREQYLLQLQEAKTILESAHTQKQQIIQEAELFLIELSCEISRIIIHRQLTVSEDWIVEMIKKALTRKREHGLVTLCVSPAHFSYIQNSKEELALAIDSQAELQIIPDGTVNDHGCVIRSSLGSIDARIDTQLTEIKNALTQIAHRSKDDEQHD